MAKWNEYGLKTGTSARDEVLILDSDTSTNKRITVGDIQEFANGKMLEKENATLNTEAKTLIGAINEVDAKNDAQDEKISTLESGINEAGTKNTEQDERIGAVEKKFSDYVKKTDVDSTLSVSGSPADAKAVGDALKNDKEAIAELADKKITKFYASSQGNTNLPDSDKGKIQDMFLYGKSEQVQYKGKNLLNPTLQTQTKNGVTCTANGDGTYTVNGTATADTIFTVIQQPHEIFKDHKQLKLVGFNKTFPFNYVRLQAYFKNYRIFYDEGNGVIIDKPETDDSNIAIYVFKNATITNLTFKPMLTPDLKATYDDYEPYVGGIPSPNPDYPQEIKAVVNPKVVVRGKNLLKVTENTQTINGITFTNNGDGTYTIDGTSTDRIDRHIGTAKTEKKKQYKLVGWDKNAPYQKNVCGMYVVEKTNEFDDGGNGIIYDSTKDEVYARIVIGKGKTFNNALIKPMVTNDLTATYDDFEPYTEQSTTLPYILYAIPVSTGGNVTIGGQQYVADYVDVERGKLVRNIGSVTVTKDSITKETTSLSKDDIYIVKTDIEFLGINNGGALMSNKLIERISANYPDGSFAICPPVNNGKAFRISIPNSIEVDTIHSYRIEAIGILAKSEEIDLTPEQIQAYKSLSTNYPVTNIEVSSEQLDGYTIFNYPISMAEGWNYVKQQIGDTRDYIYDMDLQSAEAYVNSEYAVALAELEVM